MRNHLRKVVLGATAAVALGALPAPAYASVETDHCPHPPYTVESIYSCGCVTVSEALEHVVPPGIWNCVPE